MKKLIWFLSLTPMRKFGEYLRSYFNPQTTPLPIPNEVKSKKEKQKVINLIIELLNDHIKVNG